MPGNSHQRDTCSRLRYRRSRVPGTHRPYRQRSLNTNARITRHWTFVTRFLVQAFRAATQANSTQWFVWTAQGSEEILGSLYRLPALCSESVPVELQSWSVTEGVSESLYFVHRALFWKNTISDQHNVTERFIAFYCSAAETKFLLPETILLVWKVAVCFKSYRVIHPKDVPKPYVCQVIYLTNFVFIGKFVLDL